MDNIVGNYLKTGYGFLASSRTITVYGVYDPFNLETIKMITNNGNGTGNGFLLSAPSSYNSIISYSKPPSGLTIGTPTSGGSINLGLHYYKITYVMANGDETLASVTSSGITISSGNQTVQLSNIPIGISGVTARNIYRTTANTTNYLLLTTISNNTTTTYSDSLSDFSLTTAEPVSSYVYDITYTGNRVLNSDDKIFIYYYVPDIQKLKTIADYTNHIVGTEYSTIIECKNFKYGSINLIGTCGSGNTMTVSFEVPLKENCVNTDSVNWINITGLIYGDDTKTSLNVDYSTPLTEIILIDNPLLASVDKIRVKQVYTNSLVLNNTFSVSVKLSK